MKNGRRSNPTSDLTEGGEQKMSVTDVLTLLILITNIVALVVNICNKKR